MKKAEKIKLNYQKSLRYSENIGKIPYVRGVPVGIRHHLWHYNQQGNQHDNQLVKSKKFESPICENICYGCRIFKKIIKFAFPKNISIMISSMTGFGRGSAQTATKRIKVEIKSLNSKQLDLSLRVPSAYRELEVTLRTPISEALERGKVEASVSVENIVAEATATVNYEVLGVYKAQLEELGARLSLPAPADWYTLLMRMPEAMKNESPSVGEDDEKAFLEACREALSSLVEFRRQEGRKLYGFFVEKINSIASLLKEVDPYEAERVPKIRERLEEQLGRLSSIEYDRGRLEQELIFYIEKLDVTEEKLRLSAHLNYFLETLGGENDYPKSGQGKKLGFIAQEIGREINTLGSKSNHAGMQKIVVRMKDDLEQIKEQVLNVL